MAIGEIAAGILHEVGNPLAAILGRRRGPARGALDEELRIDPDRYGQVSYQYAALAKSLQSTGGDAIEISGNPPGYLNPLNTDVLRKRPVKPFIEQDEWRIAVFTQDYIENNPMAPLKVNVSPSHFYPYLSA